MVDDMSGRLTLTSKLTNHNSELQVIALLHSVLERKLAILRVGDIVRGQLLFPLPLPSRVSRTVILWVDGQSGLIVLEVCDDVAPTLVVMDAKSDDEALAREGPETKGARRSTSFRPS